MKKRFQWDLRTSKKEINVGVRLVTYKGDYGRPSVTLALHNSRKREISPQKCGNTIALQCEAVPSAGMTRKCNVLRQ